MQDHYSTLGVARHAAPEVIKAAYRALAKKYHPDSPGGTAERFRAINAAWQVLSDAKLREQYDLSTSSNATPRSANTKAPPRATLFERIRHAAAALLVFGGGGFVPLLLVVLALLALNQFRTEQAAPTALKVPTAPTAPLTSTASGPSVRNDQQVLRNGLTKATNDYLLGLSKSPPAK